MELQTISGTWMAALSGRPAARLRADARTVAYQSQLEAVLALDELIKQWNGEGVLSETILVDESGIAQGREHLINVATTERLLYLPIRLHLLGSVYDFLHGEFQRAVF